MTAPGLVYLFIWLCLATLNYFAISRIIAKAGFSPWWVLCPITPLALVFFLFLMVAVEAHQPSLQPDGFGATIAGLLLMEYLIGITTVLNWVLFLVFAFVKWPVQFAAETYGRGMPPVGPSFGPPPGFAVPPQTFGSAVTPPPMASTNLAFAAAPKAAPKAAAPAAPTRPPDDAEALYADPLAVAVLTKEPPAPAPTIFCSWCGNERAADSHAIHYCGSSERPAEYCVRCGTTFDGAPTCPSCGTPATELSKAARRR